MAINIIRFQQPDSQKGKGLLCHDGQGELGLPILNEKDNIIYASDGWPILSPLPTISAKAGNFRLEWGNGILGKAPMLIFARAYDRAHNIEAEQELEILPATDTPRRISILHLKESAADLIMIFRGENLVGFPLERGMAWSGEFSGAVRVKAPISSGAKIATLTEEAE